jgi:alpha-tubulin suppressor-like RCC1 family protein
MNTGAVQCWGNDEYGQLGNGATHVLMTPPKTDLLGGVQAIAAGGSHTCALMTTGGVRCWGNNDYGQIGDGSTKDRRTPPTADVLSGV